MKPSHLRAILSSFLLLLLAGCAAKVADKMVVQFNYKGTLSDGTVFDSSEGGEPVEFVVGVGMMIPGLEEGMRGLKAGDKKTITVKAADAYGERDEAAVQEIPRSEFPEGMALEVGVPMTAQTEQGQMYAVVTELREDTVMVDFNHPMAGKDLTFEVEIVKVRRPTDEERAQLESAAQ
jgi:peptidylprolyl isomerase